MLSDRSWRADASVKWAIKTAKMQPWDIMLVNCPSLPCGAQNYFEDGISQDCRLCGTSIADRADEMYSVGVAMELDLEELRLSALGQIDEILDPNKSSIGFYGVPPDPDAPKPEPPAPPPSRGRVAITMLWILLSIGLLGAMAVLSRYLDGNL